MQIMLDKISPDELVHIKCEVNFHSMLRHPNIIEFMDWILDGDDVYIVLEYAEKGSVFNYLNINHPLPEDLARRILYDTCQAVKYLQSHGLVHRDIKPENLLLDGQKRVKLCDFGYCSTGEDPGSEFVCGTLEYMPPEVLVNRMFDSSTDVWALGVLLYELLHNKEPFKPAEKTKTAMFQCLATTPLHFRTHCSTSAKKLIERILQFSKEARPTLASILADQFFQSNQEKPNTNTNNANTNINANINSNYKT